MPYAKDPNRMPLAPPARIRRKSSLFARGESMVWLTGGGLILCLLMVIGLLVLVFTNGASTFWPGEVVRVQMHDGAVFMGEVTRHDTFAVPADQFEQMPVDRQQRVRAHQDEDGKIGRSLIRTANYDLTQSHFTWVNDFDIARRDTPEWAVLVERRAWGRFYGSPKAFLQDGVRVAQTPASAWALFQKQHEISLGRVETIHDLEDGDVGEINEQLNDARLSMRSAQLDHGKDSPEFAAAHGEYTQVQERVADELQAVNLKIAALRAANEKSQIVFETADGTEKAIVVAEIVRAYRPNSDETSRLGVYASRWWEFLTADPREANTEGGVWPAIVGTIVMTLIMTLLVVPFGVLAALYLREYAKQGKLVGLVRIAVGNLAGVPSIVFGVFGLGFLCYIVGGTIDQLFFGEHLLDNNPMFGKGGLLWASLTLALLTLPVVIVATEEALAAVPNSMREGSYACGASKWQTIRRIVLPRAAPGIMTGTILAIARGAGEVAPLMLVGAVKLAPELPVDATAPFIHPERSFMHLGFHIYDIGFQSPNSEAAKPMVFTTTMLLIGIVVLLNVVAIWIRGRLRRTLEV